MSRLFGDRASRDESREREADRYFQRRHDEIAPSRRPAFLREDCGSSDSGPLVIQERDNLDTTRRRRERGAISSSPPPPERVRRRVIEHSPTPVRDRYAERRHVDEVVWDLSRSKDTTVHLELDVAEDLEGDLEEFNRLTRLGRFHAAKIYFRDNLEHQMDNPYVLVQYANMLSEMGDYGGIDSLHIPDNLKDYWDLRTNWNLIGLDVGSFTGSLTEDGKIQARKKILPLDNISWHQELSSTQCQILRLSFWVFMYVPEADLGYFEWGSIYTILYRQGRFWDFVDLFLAAVDCFGLEQACRQFFNGDFKSIDLLYGLFNDWAMGDYDEISTLAILDIATTSTLEEMSQENLPTLRTYMRQAEILAQSLVEHSPSKLKTRQYIRWMLAKVAVSSSDQSIWLWRNIMEKLPGFRITTGYVLDLPMYVPISRELLEWQAWSLVSGSIKILETALEASKQLGDYITQAWCLKLLILHSKDPIELYNELIDLQKSVQKDMVGWLRTCLSKYIVCRDKDSRDCLRDELLSMDKSLNVSVELQWGRLMVLRSLAHSEDEASNLLLEASVSLKLPKDIMRFMTKNGLVKIVTASDPRAKEPRPSKGAATAKSPLPSGKGTQTETPAVKEIEAEVELEANPQIDDGHRSTPVAQIGKTKDEASFDMKPGEERGPSAGNEIIPLSSHHRSFKNGAKKVARPPRIRSSNMEEADLSDTSRSESSVVDPPAPGPEGEKKLMVIDRIMRDNDPRRIRLNRELREREAHSRSPVAAPEPDSVPEVANHHVWGGEWGSAEKDKKKNGKAIKEDPKIEEPSPAEPQPEPAVEALELKHSETQSEYHPGKVANNNPQKDKSEEWEVKEVFSSESEAEDVKPADRHYLDDVHSRRGSDDFYRTDNNDTHKQDRKGRSERRQDHYEYEDPPQVKIPNYVDGPECEEIVFVGDRDGDKKNRSSHISQKGPKSGKSPSSKPSAARFATAVEEKYVGSGW